MRKSDTKVLKATRIFTDGSIKNLWMYGPIWKYLFENVRQKVIIRRDCRNGTSKKADGTEGLKTPTPYSFRVFIKSQ